MRPCAVRSRLRSSADGSGERDATSASTASNNSDMEHLPADTPSTDRKNAVQAPYESRTQAIWWGQVMIGEAMTTVTSAASEPVR